MPTPTGMLPLVKARSAQNRSIAALRLFRG